ncbi:flagellar type III secretion system protein FlhB [Pseudothauera nasutitermitis]|uniref:Flagellar biosynthetic protein FlhB n=1 Tax=Pseudothauera nasutitermitis TaxID=2565930 RepID=A0A4S4AZV4_9RHOO|nr:flagellar biosynthesis protein FlhB [Pseudothauera nasutitermitis]THF65740.1 flagellar type III secretion system protein FlhB [Pseudothauera nasutitermitis]
MADESSSEDKTEQPTGRRLEQAREEGQVPQSRELSTFLVVMTGVATLWALGGWMAERMYRLIRKGFTFEREAAFDHTLLLERLHDLLGGALFTLAPLFLALLVAAVASPILLGGLVFSPKALGFKFERMNPIKGLGRMFSTHGLMEMVKAILKALIVGGVASMALWSLRDHIFDFMTQPLEVSMPDFMSTVAFTSLLIASSLGLLALLDVPFQLYQYQKKLRMTKEEVKRENKEQEGDPHVKGRIRAIQREMARNRMMAAVPQADVVVTNPTHFSVALKYDPEKMGAPVVLAKGRGELALKIREIAKENDVPLLEAPPLARALYTHCELEQAIPAALYTAVAEVMAYIYQLNNWVGGGGPKPEAPVDLQVPEGMDPGSPD